MPNLSRTLTLVACLIATQALMTTKASAARVLLVADSTSDTGIAAALEVDGHRVTVVTMDFASGSNARLVMPVGDFDIVVWSADGTGDGSAHTDPAVFANLSAWVTGGGRVLVTGYNSVASPPNPALVGFLGGGDARTSSDPARITSSANSLSTGVVDIRGMMAPALANTNCVRGLQPGTVSVLATSGDASCSQWTLRTLGLGQVAYISSGRDMEWETTALYNAAIRNFVAALESGTTVAGAPAIDLDGPLSLAEGSAGTLTATVTDPEGDTFTFGWDTDGDGVYNEHEGEMTYTIAAGTTDGPAQLHIGVSAMDPSGHATVRTRLVQIANVAPVISSSPPRVGRVGVPITYPVTATDPGGARDPLTYVLTTGPQGAVMDGAGVVTWTPMEMNSAVPFVVTVSDDDGGSTIQHWAINVSIDNLPTKPEALFPINSEGLVDRHPRLVVSNGVDLDFDPLTYFFEIDSTDTFDSPQLQQSEGVTEGQGYTFWYPPTDLVPGTVYLWRARVSDGAAPSDWTMGRFLEEPDPRPDAAVIDDGGVASDSGTDHPPMASGCGCRVGSEHTHAPWWIGLGIAALLWRRRSR